MLVSHATIIGLWAIPDKLIRICLRYSSAPVRPTLSCMKMPVPECTGHTNHLCTVRLLTRAALNACDIDFRNSLQRTLEQPIPGSARRLPLPQNVVDREHSYTYTVFMKNITLSVDEKVLAAARRYAVEHDSSVNGLVREFLTRIAESEDRARRARARLKELSRRSAARIGAITWKRDELHER